MRYGYHMGMGFGFFGPYILLILCFAVVIAVIFSLKKNGKKLSPFIMKLLNILKENYAVGKIDTDEFARRRTVIEDTDFLNPFTLVLLERYAKCQINTEEFFETRKIIEGKSTQSPDIEKLAMGKISIEDFKNNYGEGN